MGLPEGRRQRGLLYDPELTMIYTYLNIHIHLTKWDVNPESDFEIYSITIFLDTTIWGTWCELLRPREWCQGILFCVCNQKHVAPAGPSHMYSNVLWFASDGNMVIPKFICQFCHLIGHETDHVLMDNDRNLLIELIDHVNNKKPCIQVFMPLQIAERWVCCAHGSAHIKYRPSYVTPSGKIKTS